MSKSSDGCAVGTDGELKDAKDIEWFEDKDNDHPMTGPQEGVLDAPIRRGSRQRNNERLMQATATEKLNEFGSLTKKFAPSTQKTQYRSRKQSKDIKSTSIEEDNDDSEDGDFHGDSDEAESVEEQDDDEGLPISNRELAESLPSKMIPTTGRYSGKRKRGSNLSTAVNRSDNEASSQATNGLTVEEGDNSQKSRVNAKRNPIYHFFEAVNCGADGHRGDPRDRHYKCYHGNQKIVTVKASMKSNLSGLFKVLKEASSPMYTFFLLLKERGPDDPITQDEIHIAAGKTMIDSRKSAEFVAMLKEKKESIEKAFQKQREAAQDPWDQGHFESLLVK
ncbi:hypothetical protein H0H92_003665 [Tricholoma furcatifolium]|nr:hypothetical protein H0H92_003665 [Tricholoma furcatifolium]